MVPFNVAYLGDGRFHKGVAGELWAEDGPKRVRLPSAIGPVARRASTVGRHAWRRLGQAAHQPQQCGQRLVRPDAARAAARARVSPRLRGLDARGAAPAEQGGHRPAQGRAAGAQAAPVGDRRAQLAVQQRCSCKAWKIDAKARSSMADDLAAGRKTEIDYHQRRVGRAWPSGSAPTRRSIAGSSS